MALEINNQIIKFDEHDINFRFLCLISESYNDLGDEHIRIEKWIYRPSIKEFKRTIKTKLYGKCCDKKRNNILNRRKLQKFGEALNKVENESITNLGDEIHMEFNPKIFNSYSGRKYLNDYADNFYKNPYNNYNDKGKLVFFDENLVDKDNIDELEKVKNVNKLIDIYKEFQEDNNIGFKNNNKDGNDNNENINKNENTSNIWVIKKHRNEEQTKLISKMNKLQDMHTNIEKEDGTFVPIHLRKNKPKSRLDNGLNNGFNGGFNGGLNNGFNGGFNNGFNGGFNNNHIQNKKSELTPRERRLEKYRQMELNNNNINYIGIDSTNNNNNSLNKTENSGFNKEYEEKFSLKLIGFSSLEEFKPMDIVHMVKDKNINFYVKCSIPRNRKTGKNKNICYLDFNTYDEASYAFDVLNNDKIRLDYAIITPEWVKK